MAGSDDKNQQSQIEPRGLQPNIRGKKKLEPRVGRQVRSAAQNPHTAAYAPRYPATTVAGTRQGRHLRVLIRWKIRVGQCVAEPSHVLIGSLLGKTA